MTNTVESGAILRTVFASTAIGEFVGVDNSYQSNSYPKSVTIIEVGPRDGLQREDRLISIDEKVELIIGLLGG